jgi:hypothetical protein
MRNAILGGQILKIRFIAVTVSFVVAVVILGYLLNSRNGQVWRALGKRDYFRVLAPDSVWLFQTTTFLSRLTKGPMPEPFRIIEPGIKLDGPATRRLQDILLNPVTYSEGGGSTTTPPELILRFTKGTNNLDLEFSGEFSGEFFTMLVQYNGEYKRLLGCEPARGDFESVIGPLLGKNSPYGRAAQPRISTNFAPASQ